MTRYPAISKLNFNFIFTYIHSYFVMTMVFHYFTKSTFSIGEQALETL